MPAPKFRGDYAQLNQIAQIFNKEASDTRQYLQRIKSQMQVLQGGDWVGKGATAFYQEMNSSVLPSLTRLEKALSSAAQVTRQMSQIVKTAEDEAARCFRGDGGSGLGAMVGAAVGAAVGGAMAGAAGAAVGAAVGGALGGSSGESAEGITSPSPSGSGGQTGINGNPLLAQDPNNLFTPESMSQLVGSHVQGENTQALNNAMETLATNPTGPALDNALQQIADARGRPVEAIRAEYERFQDIRQQALDNARARGIEEPPALNQFLHGDFMGSTSQMRYGRVVGDAFGIDPVFGAMLNPSGGLVGPGNAAFDAGETAVGYHGIVHDAAGYLYNYHNTGPGYDYMGLEGRDTSSPLSGQRAGIEYWRNQVGSDTTSTISQGVVDALIPTVDTVTSVGSAIVNTGSNIINWIRSF